MVPHAQARIHHLVERAAGMTPTATAIRTPGTALSYQELRDRAGEVAGRLRSRGVGDGSIVGVTLPRGADLAVAMLGILMAGAAYVPVDAALPVSRQEEMLGSLGVRAALVPDLGAVAYRHDGLDVISLKSPHAADAGADPACCLEPDLAEPDRPGDALAYVIFTSGSTGRPKPVGIGHRGLVRHALALRGICRLTPEDRVLQFHDLGFDAAAEEFFPTWAAGAELVMPPHKPPPAAMSRLVREHGITVLNLPTSYWHRLAAELRAGKESDLGPLRLVVIGGEAASAEVARSWMEMCHVPVLNTYGTTEATISSTVYLMRDRESGPRVPVGRPIDGTTAHVLDDSLSAVPAGEQGQLFLGGEGLAWGYLGRPGQTAESFLPDPFGGAPGGRLYRTGDIVRLRADGTLDFVSRGDDQVKIRGYRVEPGEIEAALNSIDQIAVACVRPSVSEPDQLVAFLVAVGDASGGHDAGARPAPVELRKTLARLLPAYMIPDRFLFLPELPLTRHGKVDRDALIRLEAGPAQAGGSPSGAGAAPGRGITGEIVRIWEEVLGVSGLDLDADFFELGGHSIMVFKIINRVETSLGISVPVSAMFEAPVLKEFIAAVERTPTHEDSVHGML